MSRADLIRRMELVLKRRQAVLRQMVTEGLDELREGTGFDRGDFADAALDAEHDEIRSHLAESESRELQQIDEALERMQDGSYGTCEQCGEAISAARLEVLPYAMRCITCQRRAEAGEPGRPREADARILPGIETAAR